MRIKSIFFGALMVFSSLAYASTYESLELLEQKVHDYVTRTLNETTRDVEIQVRVSQIDKRLKLTTCDPSKFKLFSPYQRSMEQSSTVALRCRGPVAWSLFVPVDIKLLRDVVVAQRHIAKGHLFTARDLKHIKVDTRSLRYGFFVDPKNVIGKLAKRIMIKDTVIKPINLIMPRLISKGDRINLTAANDSIRVSVKGVALKGGRLGEYISVKNLTSKRVIEAKVIGKKEVLINL